MKKSLFIFALLFTSGNIAFSQPLFEGTIPDWYTGDKSLYSTFLLSCKIARQNCPEKNIKCNNIENLNELQSMSLLVTACTNEKAKVKKSEHREKPVSSPVATASVRG